MTDFIDRQISVLNKLVESYRSTDITLNVFILKMESILALPEMFEFRDKLEDSVSVLEEINAYLLDGGDNTAAISNKIDEQINIIEKIL
ncbi:hypothetical protein [Pseudidiomarina salilacus]|uniref:hypothetical protein n=1 Tax=Pseudidiomarina salilacus TaxID=3384452 RepID=UPI0039849A72